MAKDLEVSIRPKGEVSVIDIKGDVTAPTGQPIEDAYQTVTGTGAKKILFTFASDCYINSGGIAILIGILAQSKKKEQVVRMTGLSAHFQKIFAMVGIAKYAQLFPSEDAALAEF
jgi:anti-anti-sigma factor